MSLQALVLPDIRVLTNGRLVILSWRMPAEIPPEWLSEDDRNFRRLQPLLTVHGAN